MKKHTAVAALVFLLTMSLSAQQQDKSKRPSPPGTAEVTFADGKKVTIDYSRPSVKGRKIDGGLIPHNEVWRTGANEATSLKTDTDLVIGGTAVPAGNYTLYSVRSPSSWKLIINKQTGQWGTNYDQAQDLARVDMKVATPPSAVEQFTISFEKTGGDSALLNLDWENLRGSLDLKEKK
jgi:hypothetical protein